MFGIDDAIVGSIAGSAVQGLFNSSSASANRDWQAQQSNTSYQRAVKDLKAAGLNPMLAYGNGGASTPSGSVAAPIQTGDLGVASSQDVRLKREQEELLRAQIEKTQAETRGIDNQNNVFYMVGEEKARQELRNLGVSQDSSAASIDLSRAHAVQSGAQTDVLIKSIDEIAQRIKTGQSSASQLEALANNLNLDAAEKSALARLWKDMGEGGAAAKTLLPMLQMLKSILGK